MSFVLGIIFAILAIPCLDALASLICVGMEAIKSYFAKVINKNNRTVVEPTSRPIGF